MKTQRTLALVALGLLSASLALAGDPTGSWNWTVSTPNGDIAISATFDHKDGKLTGTYKSPFGEAPISEGSFKDDAIAFSVEREFDGNRFTIRYLGKLDGDSIKGSVELPAFGGGEPTKRDWNAKRGK